MTIKEYEEQALKRRETVLRLMEQGVCFVDIDAAYIDEGVRIGAGTLVGPCVTIEGDTEIGENCFIGQNTRIKDAKIGSGVNVQSSVILQSTIGNDTTVGPFAYVRPDCTIGAHCKVGDFVEMKNSTFGDNSKASHLTYVGDSDVGCGVNLGCGVVFVNYNGSEKFRSVVEDDSFIGCNSNLISPVRVGKGAYVAAGSTVNEDVEEDALYVARTKGVAKPGWVSAKGILVKKKK